MGSTIQPRILKGFRDLYPREQLLKQNLEHRLQDVFARYGYVPIDTPVLEYAEVLLGKAGGETEKQVYRFVDQGGRDVAMRFDLTVPFARFIATNHRELPMPFRRYHIGKAYRGENTQRGRYREFTQCDFDIVGTDAAAADGEILLLIHDAVRALGVSDFEIRFSHRGLFNRMLARLGVAEASETVLRSVDKLRKIGAGAVRDLLVEAVGPAATDEVIAFICADLGSDEGADVGAGVAADAAADATADDNAESHSARRTNRETLAVMTTAAGGECAESQRIEAVLDIVEELGVGDRFLVTPSITRGLDYYTGIVFETFLGDQLELGSICSGGRYDDLASLYTKDRLPGVGASIGLDRLLAAFATEEEASEADVVVFNLDGEQPASNQALARLLREEGFRVVVYTEDKKLNAQFRYAEQRSIPIGIIRGPEERSSGTYRLKDLRSRETVSASTTEHLVAEARARTGSGE